MRCTSARTRDMVELSREGVGVGMPCTVRVRVAQWVKTARGQGTVVVTCGGADEVVVVVACGGTRRDAVVVLPVCGWWVRSR